MKKNEHSIAGFPKKGKTVEALVDLLHGGNAHANFEKAVKDIPSKLRGMKPDGLPYSIWQLVEHIRIAQRDIVEFSRDENYKSPVWPDQYWPKETSPVNDSAWQNSLAEIKNDLGTFIALLRNPASDLYQPFPYGDGQNLIREALLIADHTAYHTGEIIIIRRILKNW